MILNHKLFILPSNEIKSIGLNNLTYGSLTDKGIKTVVNTINKYIKNTIYVFDLGCGDGELIYHLEKLLPNSNWEGVEISEHRVNNQVRDVCIWQGDMLEENLRIYNVIHADNLCLDDDIAEKLEKKIINEFQGIYITYRKPEYKQFLQKAVYLDTVLTETTWTNHPIYYYLI
jgi:tRNA G46 methylase TrmB